MNPIAKALAYGYGADKIIEFMTKAYPAFGPKVSQARKAGYTTEKILQFLANTMDGGPVDRTLSQSEIHAMNRMKQEQTTKGFLKGSALALGGIGLAAANMMGDSQEQKLISTQPPTQPLPGPQPTPSPMQQTPGQAIGQQVQQPGEVTPGMAQEVMQQEAQKPPITQQEIDTNPIYQPEYDFLKKRKLIEKMQTMAKAGKSPEEIAEMLKKKLPMMEQEHIRRLGSGEGSLDDKLLNIAKKFTHPSGKIPKPIESLDQLTGEIEKNPANIDEYEKKFEDLYNNKLTGSYSDILIKREYEKGNIQNKDDLKKFIENNHSFKESKTKNDKEVDTAPTNLVMTKSGDLGEIKGEDKSGFLIDVDGKTKKYDKDVLKPPKEAAKEALELIKGFTPEQMRSAHHTLNAYDEGEKKAFFVFHNNTAYVVDDISPEEYKELSEEIEEAKTTGENIIAKWSAGEGSRGSAYNKIVKGVRDRKVQKELMKKYRKLKLGYNVFAEFQRLLNEK